MWGAVTIVGTYGVRYSLCLRLIYQQGRRLPFSSYLFSYLIMYLPLIAAFIAISGSMGVSYMADDSLPGDVLYSVKVHVNEGVRHMVAVGSEADARVSAKIIADRAKEARQLVVEGRLDSEAKDRLAQEIESEITTWNKATSGWTANSTSSSEIETRTMFESDARTNADIFKLLGVSLHLSANAQADMTSVGTSPEVPFLQSDGDSTTTDDNSSDREDVHASTSLDANVGEVINVR